MKKAVTLIIGLLLASRAALAEGKIDFSGTSIRYQELIRNSETYNHMYNDSDWGTDAILNLNYIIDSKDTVSLKYSTDDDDDVDEDGGDSQATLLYKRTDGPLEAQLAAEVSFSGTDKDANIIKDTDQTYLKYTGKSGEKIAIYPYNMNLKTGAWFGTYRKQNLSEIPGIVMTKGAFSLGVGANQVSEKNETVLALKSEYSHNVFGAFLKAQYSGVFYDEDVLGPSEAFGDGIYLGLVTQQLNVSLYKKLSDNLAMFSEVAYNKLDKNTLKVKDNNGDYEYINSGVAGILGVDYQLTSKLKPYANIKYITDGFLGYWRQDEKNTNKGTAVEGVKTGGTTEYSIGANYQLYNNLVLNLEGQYAISGEKMFYSYWIPTGNAGSTWTSDYENKFFQVSAAITYNF